MDNKELWDSALAEIETSVSKANFGTWFRNTSVLKALRNNAEYIKQIEYIITKGDRVKFEEQLSKPIFRDQLELTELYVNKDDNLNPKYIFDNFIVGPFNEMAYAAGQAIIKSPGVVYNPLYIYGGTGLGKTHITQAIGNSIKRLHPNKKVYYITSEKFVIEVVSAIQNNKANIFKEKYRKYDVFIMDDIQFIANKDKSQEELFHLFNSLYDQNKQIIFSSDKIPKYIPNLEERLRSRFEGGMMVDIAPPDYESRLAVLKSKIKNSDFTPSDEVIEYVA